MNMQVGRACSFTAINDNRQESETEKQMDEEGDGVGRPLRMEANSMKDLRL